MKPILLYLVTEDWYFYSHRLPMARAARDAGFDVGVICHVHQHRERIEAEGFRVIHLSLERRSLNPFLALRQIAALTRIYRREKPALVHHIAMKPVLYGSVAAWVAGTPRVLNAFAGLGYVFRATTPKARLIRPVLLAGFRTLFRRKGFWTLFQNGDDRAVLEQSGVVVHDRTAIIRGSGVDTGHYQVHDLPPAPPFICVYAGRMIDMKGLPTLRAAFDILKDTAPHIHLWLCGKPDHGTPGSWDEERLAQWCGTHRNVTWKGHQQDMAPIWAQAHLAVQPTWGGEGLPKALLEAGACGRAMVATDVSGNREIVIPGRNGLLVPEKDAAALADAILQIASDPRRCSAMGMESRKLVESDMSAQGVGRQIVALYAHIMAGPSGFQQDSDPLHKIEGAVIDNDGDHGQEPCQFPRDDQSIDGHIGAEGIRIKHKK
ncbi:MAG: glycosyltransferase family 4 protein [Micavibrio aeruginosavorus]|nr:glycosyltransferase family 4 protein [Micavibrio aeruginosavorus]